MARYPSDDHWLVRTGRFANILDDANNALSPVKLNLWAANLAGASTVAAGIFAWLSAHLGMLDHVSQIGDLVGPYLFGSHAVHHLDKRERNIQQTRMK